MSNYKNLVCRSFHGCGHCERCLERRAQAEAEKSDTHQIGGKSGSVILNDEPITGLPVKGYKSEQPAFKVALVNENKLLEELVLRQMDVHVQLGADLDQRSVALARTHLQNAFMWLNRAVFQPERIEDVTNAQELVDDLIIGVN